MFLRLNMCLYLLSEKFTPLSYCSAGPFYLRFKFMVVATQPADQVNDEPTLTSNFSTKQKLLTRSPGLNDKKQGKKSNSDSFVSKKDLQILFGKITQPRKSLFWKWLPKKLLHVPRLHKL